MAMRTSVRCSLAVVTLGALVLSGCTNGKGSRGSRTSATPVQSCPISQQLTSGGIVHYSGTECRGAKLAGARLVDAELSGADLSGADLANADLSRARLEHADLTGANLAGATLVETDLTDAGVKTADLTGATLKDLRLAEGSYLLWATGLTRDSLAAGLGVDISQLHRAIAAQRLAPVAAENMESLLSGVCTGTPQPEAMTPAASASTHALNFVRDRNSQGQGAVATPANWTAPVLVLAEYVGCLSTKAVELERCTDQSATSSPSGAGYTRYRQDVTVRILEANTGTERATKVVHGPPPAACRPKVEAAGSPVAAYGKWPTAEVLSFAQAYAGTPPETN